MSLSGKLPSGDGNGLIAVVSEMIRDPKQMHVAVCIVDCAKITTNADTGETEPTVRIRRIEVITEPDDRGVAESVMRKALDRRSGQEALPYNLEMELKGVFDAAPPDTEADTEAGTDDGSDELGGDS